MNVNQIEIALSQKISASSTDFDLLAASKALQLLKTNGVFVVSTYGGLPAATSNEGKIYFIEDIETVVWSNGTDWLRLLDKSTIQVQLWGWGFNNPFRLGDGTGTQRCSPVREICSATDWSQVSAGDRHGIATKTSGELWVWGGNNCGGLGDGTSVNKCSPVREFCSATDWCQVCAGCFNSAAIKTSGEIWSWGRGACGVLGDGTVTDKCSPVREICSATDWCQLSIFFTTTAIKTDGTLWAWGNGSRGQLGNGTTVCSCSPVREICSATNWCQVGAGNTHTAAIKTSGELWVWGCNFCGSLGDGTVSNRCSPVREFCSATDWCSVNAGCSTAAVKTDGSLWSWGVNRCGVSGDGTQTERCSPVREFCSATDWCGVGRPVNHVAAIKTSGQIWTWGCNYSAQLGDGTTTGRCSPVREFCSATDWYQVSVGGGHVLATKIIL